MESAKTTQHRSLSTPSDEEQLTNDFVALATRYGRYGYQRIAALLDLLNEHVWRENYKRVEKIWRREGIKVPEKKPKRSRLWVNNASCTRIRPEYKDHVWSYDFMIDRMANGRAFKILNLIDEYPQECMVDAVSP